MALLFHLYGVLLLSCHLNNLDIFPPLILLSPQLLNHNEAAPFKQNLAFLPRLRQFHLLLGNEMLPFAQLNFLLHFPSLIQILLLNGMQAHLRQRLHLGLLRLDTLPSRHVLSFKQSYPVLKHLDLIFCLLSHLPLLEHFNAFLYEV